MEIYQFIKYHSDLSFGNLIKTNNGSLTYCFDFEDSIQDVINPDKNASLKKKYRTIFESIIHNNHQRIKNFPIGIRLNQNDSLEQKLDIDCLKKISSRVKIKSILLPKTESCEDVERLQTLLKREQIDYYEIVPIIETFDGLNNLTSIIKQPLDKIYKVAFGHCDFNLSNNIFPFYHQDSEVYWTWILQIATAIDNKNILFLNSAYLQINDDNGFKQMLSCLSKIFSTKYGQFTMTHKQTQLCQNFNNNDEHGIRNRTKEGIDNLQEYACKIISERENSNLEKGFSISKNSGEVISPHEYIAAKKYLNG